TSSNGSTDPPTTTARNRRPSGWRLRDAMLQKQTVEARPRDSQDLRRPRLLASGRRENARDVIALRIVEGMELRVVAVRGRGQDQVLGPNDAAPRRDHRAHETI